MKMVHNNEGGRLVGDSGLDVAASPRTGVDSQPLAESRLTNLYRQIVLWDGEGTGTERGLVLTLGDVLFDDNCVKLLPAARAKLDGLADYLNAFPECGIQIEGHADSVEFNQALAQQRAEAVSAYLMRKQVAPHRVSALSRPVAENSPAAGRDQNRRVEIILDRRQRRTDEAFAEGNRAEYGNESLATTRDLGLQHRTKTDAHPALGGSARRVSTAAKEAEAAASFGRLLRPEDNAVIAAFPEDVRLRLLPEFEPVQLPLGKVLYEPDERPAHVYFPVTSIVALLCMMEDGFSAGVAVAGRDSLAGLGPLTSRGHDSTWAIVQTAGLAYRLPGKRLMAEFQHSHGARDMLMGQLNALLAQTAQTAACNRHHTIYQQLARWLLMSLDRVSDDRIVLTQDLIANMLGVRREGVTEAAGRLQKRGIIEYRRGHIRLLDRVALERASCECYAATRMQPDLPRYTRGYRRPG